MHKGFPGLRTCCADRKNVIQECKIPSPKAILNGFLLHCVIALLAERLTQSVLSYMIYFKNIIRRIDFLGR